MHRPHLTADRQPMRAVCRSTHTESSRYRPGVGTVPRGSCSGSGRAQTSLPSTGCLGALGITLGLSLDRDAARRSSLGNVIGCAVFGAFNVIGHRTAVNQMVLGRAPFGRYGSVRAGSDAVCLDDGLGRRQHLGGARSRSRRSSRSSGSVTTPWLDFVVAAAIMGIQLGLALYGFYAIRSFEKYTVPVTVAGDGDYDSAGDGDHRRRLDASRARRWNQATSSPPSPNCSPRSASAGG